MQSPHGKSVFDMDANVVGLLCYLGNFVCMLGLVLSIITVIQDKTNKLARFHAWQSIFLSIVPFIGLILLFIILLFGGIIGGFIDAMIGAPIFTLIVGIVTIVLYFVLIIAGLLMLVGQIIAAVKAVNGEIFKLPVVGKMAEKRA